MDSRPRHGNWWYAIGAKKFLGSGTIPGPFDESGKGVAVTKVELFAQGPGN